MSNHLLKHLPSSRPESLAGCRPEIWKPLTVIGLMSGTSVDSVDACCAKFWLEGDEKAPKFCYEIIGTYTEEMPGELRGRLLSVMACEESRETLPEICRLNVEVAELFVKTVLGTLKHLKLSADQIDYIGSHGQTVYHLPPVKNKSGKRQRGATLQIGDGSVIAKQTGIKTVADFRPADMAVGGQGAPLVPFADVLLFQQPDKTCCVQNIGGIANMTVVPPPGKGEPLAFDSGPGNVLIDLAMARFFEQAYDSDGKIAQSGKIDDTLINALLADPYFQEPPPKSTGREYFGIRYFEKLLDEHPGLKPEDWIATLTFFSAKTIALAYQQFVFSKYDVSEIIVAGGGIYNRTLMGHLETLLKIPVKIHEDYGVPSKYKEALAFAILAWATAVGIPGNVPSCTGAERAVVLGKICF